MTIKITPNDKGNPPGKLADAELHFSEGPLDGLKLIGFSVWERRGGTGRNVTFPARSYAVNGERRSFALLADRRCHCSGKAAAADPRGVPGVRGTRRDDALKELLNHRQQLRVLLRALGRERPFLAKRLRQLGL